MRGKTKPSFRSAHITAPVIELPDPILTGWQFVEWVPLLPTDGPLPKIIPYRLWPTDIVQGNIGNCWALGGFGAVVRVVPKSVKRRLRQDGDKFAGTLFDDKKKKDQEIVVHMSRPLGVGRRGPKLLGVTVTNEHHLWVAMAEKVMAARLGGYEKMDGGGTVDQIAQIMTWFTGKPITQAVDDRLSSYSAQQMHEIVEEAAATGMPMTLGTPKKGVFGHVVWSLLANHTYYLYQYNRETRTMLLGNPWDAYAACIPVEAVPLVFDTMVVGPRLGLEERFDPPRAKPLPDVMGHPGMKDFRQAMRAVAGLDLRLIRAVTRSAPSGPEHRAAEEALVAGLKVAIRTMDDLLNSHDERERASAQTPSETALTV